MRLMNSIFLLIALLPSLVCAEIKKNAVPGDKGISLYWWPKVNAPQGWVHDKESSYHYNLNAFVPAGRTFSDAETVMYAKADWKPRMPEAKSLEQFITRDKQSFLSSTPDIHVIASGTFRTKDGNTFFAYKFVPSSKGNWEEVAYGEEGDFYLTFAISSRSSQEFQRNEEAFRTLIASYQQ